MVNDLVFWLTVWLNFENVLLTFKWYVFMWQKVSFQQSVRIAISSTNESVFQCLKTVLWCFNE